MTRQFVLLLAMVASAWVAPRTASAQLSTEPADDTSLARIRAALDGAPSKLTLSEPTPDFRIEIREHDRERWFEMFETPPWAIENDWRPRQSQTPSPWGSQPVVSVDLLAVASAIGHTIDAHRRERAQRAAVEEVYQTIASYCAARPNGGADITICSPRD